MLINLEHKTVMKERKFTKAIRQLLRLLAEPIKVKTNKQLELVDIDIQFTRCIPQNISENVDEVVKLNGTGLVDKETMLSILPFIADPMAILKKVKAEKEEESGSDYIDFHNEVDKLNNVNN